MKLIFTYVFLLISPALPGSLFSNMLNLHSSIIWDHVLHPYRTTGQIIILCIWVCIYVRMSHHSWVNGRTIPLNLICMFDTLITSKNQSVRRFMSYVCVKGELCCLMSLFKRRRNDLWCNVTYYTHTHTHARTHARICWNVSCCVHCL